VTGSKVGVQTVSFGDPPAILGEGTVVGPMEGQGPLANDFDVVKKDSLDGQASWEKAEARFLREACEIAANKAAVPVANVNYLFAGDLLNQVVSANFCARDLSIPFFGLYGACSTMAEAMALGAMLIDGGYADNVLAASSSHHEAAERQFRYPTEYAHHRPPSAQWTVTGAAALLLGRGSGPRITFVTPGRVFDAGLKDSSDMGSAMAPAAARTIKRHFDDTGRGPEYYDLIATGDLGSVGKPLAEELLAEQGANVGSIYIDCGTLIYRREGQDVHAGGSGCACSATVLAGHLMKGLRSGRLNRILFVATGALYSPTTFKQGESIPCIAHAVAIETDSLS